MKFSISKITDIKSGPVIALVHAEQLSPTAEALDRQTDGMVRHAIANSRFKGKHGQTLSIAVAPGMNMSRIVLAGTGEAKDLTLQSLETLGAGLISVLNQAGDKEATVVVDAIDDCGVDGADQAARIASGMKLKGYRFDRYLTRQEADSKPTLKKVTIQSAQFKKAKAAFERLTALGDGVFVTRDLVSEPANVLQPSVFADRCKGLSELGVDVEVLGEKQLKKLKMNSLLAVGQGSAAESQLVVMRWNGAERDDDAPIAFVGKGVTFDTGGISLKPPAGMWDMKWDMGGAGVVTGLMHALAARNAPVNAVGIVGLVENMPSGTATRPGDVVTSASGQTIEILNTDAEGRLVLADALWYAVDRFKPDYMVNLATLTGAIIISLGAEHCGLFSNDDALADALSSAGTAVDEKVWRLPLDPAYDKLLESPIADMQNIANNRDAGSIVAGQFLQRFVGDTKWAHLDIAGVTWSTKDRALSPRGATGFGVRLLDRLVTELYENR